MAIISFIIPTAPAGLCASSTTWSVCEKPSNISKDRPLSVIVNSTVIVITGNKSVRTTSDTNDHRLYALHFCSFDQLTLMRANNQENCVSLIPEYDINYSIICHLIVKLLFVPCTTFRIPRA